MGKLREMKNSYKWVSILYASPNLISALDLIIYFLGQQQCYNHRGKMVSAIYERIISSTCRYVKCKKSIPIKSNHITMTSITHQLSTQIAIQ
jgi:hypothetical protein